MDLETSSKTANIITWAGPEMELAVMSQFVKQFTPAKNGTAAGNAARQPKEPTSPFRLNLTIVLKSGYSQVIAAGVAAQP